MIVKVILDENALRQLKLALKGIFLAKVFPLKKTSLFAIKIHPIDNVCSECDESSELLKDHFVTHRCDSLEKISERAVFHCILGTQ